MITTEIGIIIYHIHTEEITHGGQVTPHGIGDFGQHWWHQAIACWIFISKVEWHSSGNFARYIFRRRRFWSTWTASSHYLLHYFLSIKIQWHSSAGNFTSGTSTINRITSDEPRIFQHTVGPFCMCWGSELTNFYPYILGLTHGRRVNHTITQNHWHNKCTVFYICVYLKRWWYVLTLIWQGEDITLHDSRKFEMRLRPGSTIKYKKTSGDAAGGYDYTEMENGVHNCHYCSWKRQSWTGIRDSWNI